MVFIFAFLDTPEIPAFFRSPLSQQQVDTDTAAASPLPKVN